MFKIIWAKIVQWLFAAKKVVFDEVGAQINQLISNRNQKGPEIWIVTRGWIWREYNSLKKVIKASWKVKSKLKYLNNCKFQVSSFYPFNSLKVVNFVDLKIIYYNQILKKHVTYISNINVKTNSFFVALFEFKQILVSFS